MHRLRDRRAQAGRRLERDALRPRRDRAQARRRPGAGHARQQGRLRAVPEVGQRPAADLRGPPVRLTRRSRCRRTDSAPWGRENFPADRLDEACDRLPARLVDGDIGREGGIELRLLRAASSRPWLVLLRWARADALPPNTYAVRSAWMVDRHPASGGTFVGTAGLRADLAVHSYCDAHCSQDGHRCQAWRYGTTWSGAPVPHGSYAAWQFIAPAGDSGGRSGIRIRVSAFSGSSRRPRSSVRSGTVGRRTPARPARGSRSPSLAQSVAMNTELPPSERLAVGLRCYNSSGCLMGGAEHMRRWMYVEFCHSTRTTFSLQRSVAAEHRWSFGAPSAAWRAGGGRRRSSIAATDNVGIAESDRSRGGAASSARSETRATTRQRTSMLAPCAGVNTRRRSAEVTSDSPSRGHDRRWSRLRRAIPAGLTASRELHAAHRPDAAGGSA